MPNVQSWLSRPPVLPSMCCAGGIVQIAPCPVSVYNEHDSRKNTMEDMKTSKSVRGPFRRASQVSVSRQNHSWQCCQLCLAGIHAASSRWQTAPSALHASSRRRLLRARNFRPCRGLLPSSFFSSSSPLDSSFLFSVVCVCSLLGGSTFSLAPPFIAAGRR